MKNDEGSTFELLNGRKIIQHGSRKRCEIDKALLDFPEQAEMFSPETLEYLKREYKDIDRRKKIRIRKYEPWKRKN